MKKIRYGLLLLLGIMAFSGCKEWLTILPENEQTSDKFWKSKEEVLAVLNAGYVKFRDAVPTLFEWGELRGGCIYGGTGALVEFRVTPSDKVCNWGTLYQAINMANSVLTYAPQVIMVDETFEEPVMNSYMAEAYFIRALSYFYLIRNFKEVPLITVPYVDDSEPYEKAAAAEEEVIAQIKTDLRLALESKAAKAFFPKEWETKGRATKWALYALMADVCLWDGDYDNAIIACNNILEGGSNAPEFMPEPTEWFTIYNPGNSRESIFEVQWDMTVDADQKNPLCDKVGTSGATYYYTPWMVTRWVEETDIRLVDPTFGRGLYGSYATDKEKNNGGEVTEGYVWKYFGGGAHSVDNKRAKADANYIIYRVADILLMKAEALTLLGGSSRWNEALSLVNQVRTRSSLPDVQIEEGEINEENVLDIILTERCMELAAEGKRWYDLLRFGKRDNYKYKQRFLIEKLLESTYASPTWVHSVVLDNNAHYLPIATKELQANPLLVQNPYYEIGK
ncbi:MAG: RagB/SusD family nutrient uptake outer membrane protein [Odoribacteraceae bacterium]|nr:RagB/SusD family nutrient uptake outer membrane protein [Odoribacteraceae bacterium]